MKMSFNILTHVLLKMTFYPQKEDKRKNCEEFYLLLIVQLQ